MNRWLLPWAAVWLVLNACAFVPESRYAMPGDRFQPMTADQARQLLERLADQNTGLDTFKGQGKVAFTHNGRRQSARAAWAGKQPNALRVTLRGVAGLPLASLAFDGGRLTLKSYGDNQVWTHAASDPSLARMLGADVSVGELAALLSGRTPLRAYQHCQAFTPLHADDPIVLNLIQNKQLVQRIFIDRQHRLTAIDMFNSFGYLKYHLDILAHQDIDGYDFYRRWTISKQSQTLVEVDAQQMWANVGIDSHLFNLSIDHAP
jgi:outer membrane biogenesis lipoprotein LolB